jgi:acetyltransferase-like isoleucine patch superfamily enzyme
LILPPALSVIQSLLLKVKRGQTPFYRALRRIAKALAHSRLPTPLPVRLLYGFLYYVSSAAWALAVRAVIFFWWGPLFRSRCAAVGKRFRLERLPFLIGNPRIHIGDDVRFYGKVDIMSGYVFDEPTLRIGNRVVVGHACVFIVNREITVEDGVMIAARCIISDNDGHPRDSVARTQGSPPPQEDIKPVRICRNAWIADGCHIRKGVTIGEGAIVGVSSVVLKDVPAYCIVAGNPARVVGFTS